MRNFFSTGIIAAALALGVPSNGAEAVGTFSQPMPAFTSMATPASVSQAPEPTIAWLMAFGFLGLVISRRVRGE